MSLINCKYSEIKNSSGHYTEHCERRLIGSYMMSWNKHIIKLIINQ